MTVGHTISDTNLDAITNAILACVRPRRIVLIGSRARGDAMADRDYDIVIEVASDEEARETDRLAAAALAALNLWVDVHVLSTASIERWQDDPGMLQWDIVREGVLLYPCNGSAYERLAARSAVVGEGVPDSVAGWLERARQDLKVIQHEMAVDDAAWGAVGFHAQQAAEKYLKALLVQRWIRPPRGHNLLDLVRACRTAGVELPGLSSECELLNKYAVDIRYPFRTPLPDAEEGRRIAEAGLRVVAIVQSLIDK